MVSQLVAIPVDISNQIYDLVFKFRFKTVNVTFTWIIRWVTHILYPCIFIWICPTQLSLCGLAELILILLILLTLLCFVHRWHRFALVSRKLGNMFKTFYKSCIPVFNKFLSSVFMSQGTSASGRKNLFRMVFFSNNFSLALKKNKDKNIDETVKDTKIWLF